MWAFSIVQLTTASYVSFHVLRDVTVNATGYLAHLVCIVIVV